MSNRFRSDPRLTARMTITLFLLGLLYVLFAAALIALLKSWVLVVVAAALLLAAQYWYSDRVALYAMRGRIVEAGEYPRLHGAVGLVYLYKRGTFYPFAPLPGEADRRDNALELRVRAVLAEDLRIEPDLGRWFPLWGAPGL